MQLNNYFALKVGVTFSMLSSTAFYYCAMIFADSIEPFLEDINNIQNKIERAQIKNKIGMLGAGFGFFIGATLSLKSYGIYKLIEAINPPIKETSQLLQP